MSAHIAGITQATEVNLQDFMQKSRFHDVSRPAARTRARQ